MRAPLTLLALCVATTAWAADVRAPLEPFQGSQLIASHYRANDDFDLQTSTFQDYILTTKQRLYSEPPLHLHGAHSTLWYQATGYATASEVMRHYRDELGRAGFEVLYDSSGDPDAKLRWANGFLTAFEASHELSAKGRWAFNGADSQSVRTLTARRGDLYVSLLAVEWPENVGAYEAKRGAYLALDVIESSLAPAPDELVTALEHSGHVALYEADPVARVAALLQANPTLSLRVVVHSDNQGTLEAQLTATRKRAHAIVSALKGRGLVVHGEGVGSLAPVASNATAEGRALNRRVELVAP